MDELRRLKARLKKDKYQPLMERLRAIQDERDPQEERDVANLRAALKAQGLLPPEYDEYYRLRRFLQFHKGDVHRTVERWGKYVTWRREFGTDDILSYEFPEEPQVNIVFTGNDHGVDRQGRPIFWGTMGRNLVTELLKVTTFERYLRYKVKDIQCSEAVRLPAASVVAGRTITGTTLVIDAHGLGWKNVCPEAWALLREISRFDTDYFPDLAQCILVINANTFLRCIWSTFKLFLNPSTLNKFNLFGPEYHEELFQYIDPSQVPARFGGGCTCGGDHPLGCLVKSIGPWNDPQVLQVVHLMRRGALGVRDPLDIRKLATLGRITWDQEQFKLDGEEVPCMDDDIIADDSASALSDDEEREGQASTNAITASALPHISARSSDLSAVSFQRGQSGRLAAIPSPHWPASHSLYSDSPPRSVPSLLLSSLLVLPRMVLVLLHALLSLVVAILTAPVRLLSSSSSSSYPPPPFSHSSPPLHAVLHDKLRHMEQQAQRCASTLQRQQPDTTAIIAEPISDSDSSSQQRVGQLEAELQETKKVLESVVVGQEKLRAAVASMQRKSSQSRPFTRRQKVQAVSAHE